jgi:protein-S-isoprenylcysteine O-methyltransferase Ste14
MNLEKYFENRAWIDKMRIVFYVLIVLLFVADFFIPKEHALLPGESLPGFYVVFGFIATLLIIIVSKTLGNLFITKKENFYND